MKTHIIILHKEIFHTEAKKILKLRLFFPFYDMSNYITTYNIFKNVTSINREINRNNKLTFTSAVSTLFSELSSDERDNSDSGL